MSENFDMLNDMKLFFDGCAETWDDNCTFHQEKIAAIVTLAGIKSGSRVVDIACGTGVMFSEILSRNPAEVFGIDLSSEMITKARSKFSDPRLHLLASNLFDVRETDFDTAMIFSAYPHFQDKRELAKQVSGMLNVGGRVMVAHCEGKNSINGCHTGKSVSRISWPLRPAKEEAAEFAEYFNIDILADTSDICLFSGIKM